LPASAEGRSAADNARAVRDELVHALMPELRALVEHLVKTTVERSVASLFDRQRELEGKLERVATSLEKQRALPAAVERAATPSPDGRRELEAAVQSALAPLLDRQRGLETALSDLRRAQSLPQDVRSIVAARAPEPATSLGSAAVAQAAPVTRPAPILPAVGAAPRAVPMQPLTAAFTAAHDPNASWDIPAELNGSRRKRAVIWILAIAVILLLLSVAGLSVLSNTGRYL